MRHLFAWDEDSLVGTFSEDSAGRIAFEYGQGRSCPISLSLPLDGGWDEDAPKNYLDGLLPDRASERVRMASALCARGSGPFDLLDATDIIGGLVYTSSEEPPGFEPGSIAAMTPDDVEAQMQQVWECDSAYGRGQDRARFALSGTQPKLAVAIHRERWLWPSAALASTHILKPDGREVADVGEVEHATIELARQLGIEVPRNEVVRFGERVGYLVERFDRQRDASGYVRRMHTEDLCQALGRTSADKYEPTLEDVTGLFHRAGVADEVAYDLVRYVAYNNGVGNADAHAKNYSLFLDAKGVWLAPLYDSICMAHWPDFKYGTLSIPVNDVYDPWEVTLSDWEAEARRCGLDPGRVVEIVRDVERGLLAAEWEALPCRKDIAEEIRAYVQECGRDLIPDVGYTS